jgi:hypothetical protein
VDKTEFIKEWWDSGDAVTLITRPRRFGKTLYMSMLNCFFSNKYENRGGLFEGLNIWRYDEYREIQGTYPVINITFANIKESKYESACKMLQWIFSQVYDEHRYLLDSNKLTEYDKKDFDKLLKSENIESNIDEQIEEKDYAQSLIDRGVKPERIRKYGFAFEGKTVEIG